MKRSVLLIILALGLLPGCGRGLGPDADPAIRGAFRVLVIADFRWIHDEPLQGLPTGEVSVTPLIGEVSFPQLDASGKYATDINLTEPTVNYQGSPQGNGWGVAGLQQLVKGLNGALLLIEHAL